MPTEIEGQPARAPHSISGAFQDYNDPPYDSPFTKVDDTTNRCGYCEAVVYNNTESRDGHMNRAAGDGRHAHLYEGAALVDEGKLTDG